MIGFSNYQRNALSVGRVEKHVLNMSIVCLIFISLLVLVSSSACAASKVLDEKRATVLIKGALQSESFMISPGDSHCWPGGDIAPLMSRSMNDYKSISTESPQANMLGQLIKDGLVTQRTYVESYPDLSGVWEGNVNEYYYDKLDLTQASGSNEIRGTCYHASGVKGKDDASRYRYGWIGSLEGTVDAGGRVSLAPISSSRNGCLGRHGEISYQYTEEGTTAAIRQVSWGHVVLAGKPAGKTTVTTYDYSFSPGVRTSSNKVEVGRYEVVGQASGLLLDGPTRAHATFSWRVSLNKLGSVMLRQQPTGNGTAQFAKKPDGTWVLVPPIRF